MSSYNDIVNKQALFAIETLSKMNVTKIKNPTIVFDIDNTLINNDGHLITPIFQVYLYALRRGFMTAIITARTSTGISYTINQLEMMGISGYSQLYMRESSTINIKNMKLESRKSLHDKGYTVIMSIGDMIWDVGEYGGIPVLVPTIY